MLPISAVCAVKDLFIPENHMEACRAEADSLPTLEITKVTTKCFQHLIFFVSRFSDEIAWKKSHIYIFKIYKGLACKLFITLFSE